MNKKNKLILLLILLAISIGCFICFFKGKKQNIKPNDNMHYKIELKENASALLKWDYEIVDNKKIIDIKTSTDYSECGDLDGCSGKIIYDIIGKKNGTVTIFFKLKDSNSHIIEFRKYVLNIDSNLKITEIKEDYIQTSSEIKINEETWIVSEENIYFSDNDYIRINETIKSSKSNQNETTSFSLNIPYTISLNNENYDGNYVMGDKEYKLKDDNNPKYEFIITNYISDGIVEVLLTEK